MGIRRVGRFLTLALLATITVSTVGQRAAGATTNQFAYQWNICGGQCFMAQGEPLRGPRDHLEFLYNFQVNKPLIISLNEVCQVQYLDADGIRPFLISKGYQTYNYVEDAHREDCGGGPILNVIAAQGVFVSHVADNFPTQDGDQIGQIEGYACIRTSGYIPLSACSTHVTSASGVAQPGRSFRQQQSDEMIFIATGLYPNAYRTIAGDWNIRPQERYLLYADGKVVGYSPSPPLNSPYHTGYLEAAGNLPTDNDAAVDPECPNNCHIYRTYGDQSFLPGHPLQTKIDYIWFMTPGFTANPLTASASIIDMGVSDHRLLWGRFAL